MEVGTQGRAVTGNGNGISGEGIADEVADGEVHIEWQVCTNEGKAAGYHGFQAMLLAHQGAEMFGGAFGLAIGRVGICQGQTAWPIFRDGGKISGLRTVDGAYSELSPRPDPIKL